MKIIGTERLHLRELLIDDKTLPEIGFHIIKEYCNKGLVTEANFDVVTLSFNHKQSITTYYKIKKILS